MIRYKRLDESGFMTRGWTVGPSILFSSTSTLVNFLSQVIKREHASAHEQSHVSPKVRVPVGPFIGIELLPNLKVCVWKEQIQGQNIFI